MESLTTQTFYKAIILASLQGAIIGIELESKLSLKNIDSQEELDFVLKHLRYYTVIGTLWSIAIAFILQSLMGILIGVGLNTLIMWWVISDYIYILKNVAQKQGLKYYSPF